MSHIVPIERIEKRIFLFRGHKVMLDSDRFPEDFMFQLGEDEAGILVSQNVIPSRKYLGGYLPYVFTQEGIAMLSSVLRSKRAIRVNLSIMRAFVKLREMLATHRDLARQLEELERKYDAQFKVVFDAIRKLMEHPEPPRRRIGFHAKKSDE